MICSNALSSPNDLLLQATSRRLTMKRCSVFTENSALKSACEQKKRPRTTPRTHSASHHQDVPGRIQRPVSESATLGRSVSPHRVFAFFGSHAAGRRHALQKGDSPIQRARRPPSPRATARSRFRNRPPVDRPGNILGVSAAVFPTAAARVSDRRRDRYGHRVTC